MPITMLSGLGCGCQAQQKEHLRGLNKFRGMSGVNDYDIITIGGKQYTVNQILDKTVVASRDIKTYSRPGGTELGVVKAGQPIGKVFSYIRSTSAGTGGRPWLMFETTYNNYFYVPDDAVSGSGIKEQGGKTVEEEIQEEEDQKLKESSPMEYYFKKFAPKVLLGVVVVAGTIILVKEVSKGVVTKAIATN